MTVTILYVSDSCEMVQCVDCVWIWLVPFPGTMHYFLYVQSFISQCGGLVDNMFMSHEVSNTNTVGMGGKAKRAHIEKQLEGLNATGIGR